MSGHANFSVPVSAARHHLGRWWPSWFLTSSSIILMITGVAKILGVSQSLKILGVSDPIFGFSFGHLMLLAGTLEVVVALRCFAARPSVLNVAVVMWLATAFVIYRAGLFFSGWHGPCPCLGQLSDVLHLRPEFADSLMKWVLAYLLGGGCAAAALLWYERKRTSSIRSIKARTPDHAAHMSGTSRSCKAGPGFGALLGISAVLVAFDGRAEAAARGYAVTGSIVFTNFDDNGKFLMGTTNNFVVVVRGCLWEIRLLPGDTSITDYHYIAYDGSNVYHYANLETGIYLRRQKGELVGKNSGIATVLKGMIPRFSAAHEANPIWVAFASQCYWRTVKDSRSEPAAVLNANSGSDLLPWQVLYQSTHTSFCTNEPFLPERLVYFDDGVFREPGSTRRHPYIRMPAAYAVGFTNTIYAAHDFEVMSGLYVPKRSTFITFWPAPKGTDASQLRVMNEYKIIVRGAWLTNVAPVFPIPVPGLTSFVDFRFASELNPIRVQYLGRERFLNDAEVRRSREFEIAMLEHATVAAPPPNAGSVRFWTLTALCVITALLAVSVIKNRKEKKEIGLTK